MTKKSEGWISRRGQAGAATAVELVLERQPQEPVLQIADELIEDSPYQARGPISDASVSELAQGMVSAGFQGVLIVRPHSDLAKRRHGAFQLVYGHRRRAAWRLVCQERGEPCMLPVVVREVSDAQMLTIGAQENLQRQDLDPVEEAQIVAWAERMFFDRNQAEIGAMLGKSEDWVRLRSRVARLPEPLRERLRARPRAMSQILELATLHRRDPDRALALADRIVREQLTVERVRQLLRSTLQPALSAPGPQLPQCDADAGACSTAPLDAHISFAARADALHPAICDENHKHGVDAAIVTPRTAPVERHASADGPIRQQVHQLQRTVTDASQQIAVLQAHLADRSSEALSSRERAGAADMLTRVSTELDELRTAVQALTAMLAPHHRF